MIHFSHKEKRVWCSVKVYESGSDGVNDQTVWLHHDMCTELEARVFAEKLRDVIHEAMQDAHRDAYEQGWKDAKAKRPKAKTFSGYLSKAGTRRAFP